MRSPQSLGLSVIDGQMALLNALHQPLNFMFFISAFFEIKLSSLIVLLNIQNSLKQYIIAGAFGGFNLARRWLIYDVLNAQIHDRRESL